MKSKLWQGIVLAGFAGVCLTVGAIGAAVTIPSVSTWYRTIAKPGWTPPDGVFGPVWTTLYIMMAVSAWLVWRQEKRGGRRRLLVFWWVQLALNAAWSPLFFGIQEPGWAFFDITALWIVISVFLSLAWRNLRPAALLFLPYWFWVSYAATLNAAVWLMNSGRPAAAF